MPAKKSACPCITAQKIGIEAVGVGIGQRRPDISLPMHDCLLLKEEVRRMLAAQNLEIALQGGVPPSLLNPEALRNRRK